MKWLSIILLAGLAGSALSQTADTLPSSVDFSYGIIDTVIVIGNNKTKASVVLREMALKRGSEATPRHIDFDRNRIYSLGLFNRVDIFFQPLDGQNFLVVDVSERWYIIPVPLFGFREGDPKKPYFGGGVLHNNFRGLNQKIFGSIVFGYNPSLSLFFSDPHIDHEHDLYFSGALSFSRIRNKSQVESSLTGDFDERHYNISTTLGKRFSIYESAGINVGFQMVDVTQYRPGRTVSPTGIDRFLYASINYTYDSRNLRDYPTQGKYVNFYVTKMGLGESALSFTRFGGDVRNFLPLPLDLTFASRFHGSIVSGGVIPTYSRSYFGYGERIRGYFRTVFEGENIFGTSHELRFLILKPRTILFSALPIPEEFSVWRFGISLAVFADAGVTWFRKQTISFDSFASGYGGGIHFLLPYDFIVRTEYAWNQFRRGQFIFDVRASF